MSPVYGASKYVLVPEDEVGGVPSGGGRQVAGDGYLKRGCRETRMGGRGADIWPFQEVVLALTFPIHKMLFLV